MADSSVFDRVRVSTSTLGTGPITLGAAVLRYRSFVAAGVPNGTTVSYAIEEGTAWELGTGVYNNGVLTRTLKSSSTGALINLQGDAQVFITILKDDLEKFAPKDSPEFTGPISTTGSVTGSNLSGTHSGNSSGTNTGDQSTIAGNAGTATKLETVRTINGVGFDGTANITVNAVDSATPRLPASAASAYGLSLLDDANAATARTTLGLGSLATQSGTFSGTSSGTNTGDQTTITGNAGSATVLQTARNINGVPFNGSANITINAVDSTARIAASEKGAANGVATLGADSKIPSAQLPALALADVSVAATQAAQLAIVAQEGDVVIRTDLNKTYIHNGGVAGTMADWQEMLTPTDLVTSVAGRMGAVILTKTDVGLSNVDNTSDAGKPVSTAQQTALNLKLDTSHAGTGGTAHAAVIANGAAGFMIGTDKAKLDGIAAGATANTGTVTAVGVTTLNGISGTSSGGATPNITLSLGAITPTSVAATGTVTGSNLSGTNTGDQVLPTRTSLSINNVDNTSDGAKPVSVAQQAALDLKLNISAYTAADILTKIKTVDGALSGLDADTLDGFDALDFAKLAGNATFGGVLAATNLSGVNTGDQTNITGNAGTATQLANPRSINGVTFNGTSDITISAVDSITPRIALSQKGAADGVATLGPDAKILASQLPALALTDVFTAASQAAQLALSAQQGDVAIRSDLNKSYIHNGGTAGTMADWNELLTPTDSVLSVAGRTGAVTLTKTDVGLNNVDNTSDAGKPVSTAQQAALNLKLNTTHEGAGGAVHANVVPAGASGFMTGADKTKLDGIATGATANTGTVTAVSVVSANGISGTSSGGATPALTVTLGAITPTSVAATGTVTGSNLSGTNTGDQTTITGNAGTATKLLTPRAINGVNFDGSAPITINAVDSTARLAASAVSAFGLTLVDDVDAATARSTLGLGTLATQTGTFSGTHSGSSSGTNTGDQTTITGNAGTATTLQTPRTINGVSFNGSANITINAVDSTPRLASSAVSAYGLTLIDDIDAPAARTTLGLGTLATQSGTFSGSSSGTNTGDQDLSTLAPKVNPTFAGTVGGAGVYATASASSAGAGTSHFSVPYTGDAFNTGRTGPTFVTQWGWLGPDQNYTYSGSSWRIGSTTGHVQLHNGTITATGTIAATGTVTGSNLSGTNTGDQTTITGNAGTATKLLTARTINGVSFDGSANITINAVDSTARIASTEKAAANGVATLDSNGKIFTTQLPTLALTDVTTVATQAAQLALVAQEGDVAIRTDLSKSFIHNGGVAGTMADWSELLTPTDTVSSVAGRTGAVTLTKTDVGLGNVDNTADSAKAVASAAILTTARTINGVSFNGSANITINAVDATARLASSAVSAFGLTLIDDLTNTAARTTLGLGTLATQSGTFSGTSSGTNTGDETKATIDTKLGVNTSTTEYYRRDGTWATISAGGVTAVSVASANGITGTSSGGATPALTITLGDITPTSVVSSGSISSNTTIVAAATGDGSVIIGNDGNGNIELGKALRTVAGAPFIDFHSSVNSPDFDARIQATGGSSGASGGATLALIGALVSASSNFSAVGNITGNGFIMADSHFLYSASANSIAIRIGLTGPYFNIRTVASSNMDLNNASGGDVTFSIAGNEKVRIYNSGAITAGDFIQLTSASSAIAYLSKTGTNAGTASIFNDGAVHLKSGGSAQEVWLNGSAHRFASYDQSATYAYVTSNDFVINTPQTYFGTTSGVLAQHTGGHGYVRSQSGNLALGAGGATTFQLLSNGNAQLTNGEMYINKTAAGVAGGYLGLTNTSAAINTEAGIFFSPNANAGAVRSAQIAGVNSDGGNGTKLVFRTNQSGGGPTDRMTIADNGAVSMVGNVTAPTFIGALSGNATTATKVASWAANPNQYGASRLYRRDTNDEYNVQTNYDGSRWLLRGYYQDGFHAECRVSYADNAGLLGGIGSGSYARYDLGGTFNQGQNFSSTQNTAYDGQCGTFAAYGNAATISFHRPGAYAINMGLDSDNWFRIGGWSAPDNLFQLDMAGNLTLLGNIGAYSDIKLKKNIETIPDALDKVCGMRGVTYNLVSNDAPGSGVIAQELELIAPELVTESPDGTKGVIYGNLVGYLIESIKELRAEIEELKGAK